MGRRCSGGVRQAATSYVPTHPKGGRAGSIHLRQGIRDDWGCCVAKHVTVLGIIATLLAKLIADETKAWLPWCARRFFDLSVRLLPASERARFSEEWCSHIESFPGSTFVSAQFVWAALEIRFYVIKNSIHQAWILFRASAALFCIFAYCWLNMRLNRFFGMKRTVAPESATEPSRLIVGFIIILIAIVLFKKAPETESTCAA